MKYIYLVIICFFLISCNSKNESISINYKFNVIRKLDKFKDLLVNPTISDFKGIGVELKNNSSKNIKVNFLDSYIKITTENNQFFRLDDLSYLKNDELIEWINRDLHDFHQIELSPKESITLIIDTNFNYNSLETLNNNLEFYLKDVLINNTISNFKIKASDLRNNDVIYIIDNKISTENEMIQLIQKNNFK